MANLHTVANLKDSVAGILSGIDINNVDNLYGAFERAARVTCQKADIPEASGLQNITLYKGVFDYACDPTVFGTAITDIRPQGISRPPNNFVFKRDADDFDRTKNFIANGTMATFAYANGVPIIRIASSNPQYQSVIDSMTQVGNWVAGGSASGLVQDRAVFYQSPASLRFTLTGASSGTLTETLTSATDLSSYQGVGVAFLAIDITGTASDLTSIQLKLGSDSGNYTSLTKTQGFLGAWTSGNWLLVAFDFALGNDTGTPNWSSIAYVQLTFNHSGTLTNFRVGDLFISQPSPAQILFQSAAIFVPSASSTASESITADTDTIVLNNPAYSIYEYESALSVLQQTGAGSSDSSYIRIDKILNGTLNTDDHGLYGFFRGDNPSQELRSSGSYYDSGYPDYGDYCNNN